MQRKATKKNTVKLVKGVSTPAELVLKMLSAIFDKHHELRLEIDKIRINGDHNKVAHQANTASINQMNIRVDRLSNKLEVVE